MGNRGKGQGTRAAGICSPCWRPARLHDRRADGFMNGNLTLPLPRCLAQLGGTTRWSDCVEALRYLLTPAQLVQGAKIEEDEQALAGTEGAMYAISFARVRLGL